MNLNENKIDDKKKTINGYGFLLKWITCGKNLFLGLIHPLSKEHNIIDSMVFIIKGIANPHTLIPEQSPFIFINVERSSYDNQMSLWLTKADIITPVRVFFFVLFFSIFM